MVEITPEAPANRPPELERFSVEPEVPTTETDIVATVEAYDPDGDSVDVERRWFVNGEQLLERGLELSSENFVKGDRIHLEVTLSDGERTVNARSQTLVVANSPPRILNRSGMTTQIDGVRVQVEDPDGDRCTFRFEEAPPGLTVGERSGVVSWQPQRGDEGGTYRATLVVEDGDDGQAKWVFDMVIEGPAGEQGEEEVAEPSTEAQDAADQDDRWDGRARPERWTQGEASEGWQRERAERWEGAGQTSQPEVISTTPERWVPGQD